MKFLKNIDRYQIQSHIADGGMGTVFQAYDPLLKRLVAIKIIRDDISQTSPLLMQMFEKEAEILAALEHPNILPIYDYGYIDSQPYYVLRLIKNGSLEKHLYTTKLSASEVVKIVQRLASAIDYFHEKGVIHRDLKPSNIMMGEQSHPYITDFGLTSISEQLVDNDITSGSPLYMAPEQWVNKIDDYRSDLFAFGIIIFQLFTRHYPIPDGFDPNSAIKIKNFRLNKNNKTLPSIQTFLPELPIGVEFVLHRLTKNDANERYSSATEASDALTKAFFSGQGKLDGKVFISYAHKDSNYVHQLAQQLVDFGVEIWTDKNIAPGVHWDKDVQKALDECSKMIVILSPSSAESENVKDEWSYFLDQGKKVYPFLYLDCNIPFRLRRIQYTKLSTDFLSDVYRIIEVLSGGTPSSLEDPNNFDYYPISLSETTSPLVDNMEQAQFLTASTRRFIDIHDPEAPQQTGLDNNDTFAQSGKNGDDLISSDWENMPILSRCKLLKNNFSLAGQSAVSHPAFSIITNYKCQSVIEFTNDVYKYQSFDEDKNLIISIYLYNYHAAQEKLKVYSTLQKLECKGIANIRDYGLLDNLLWVAVDYIEHKTLNTIINNNKTLPSSKEIVDLGTRLCDILSCLHDSSVGCIIHRDVVPGNICISEYGDVILKGIETLAVEYKPNLKYTIQGTEGFSSPEAYRGEVVPQSDLFSLGAILHYYSTKQDPRLESPFSFSERPITDANFQITSDLEIVIMKALEFSPNNRFQSAREMKRALLHSI